MKLIMENWRRYRQKAKLVNILLEARPMKVDKKEVSRIVDLMHEKVLGFFEMSERDKFQYKKSYFENKRLSEMPWVYFGSPEEGESRTHGRDHLVGKVKVPLVGSSNTRTSDGSKDDELIYYPVEIYIRLYKDQYKKEETFVDSGHYSKQSEYRRIPSMKGSSKKRTVPDFIVIKVSAEFAKHEYQWEATRFKRQARATLLHELTHATDYWGEKENELYSSPGTSRDFKLRPKSLIRSVDRLEKNNFINPDEAEKMRDIIQKGENAEEEEKKRVLRILYLGYANQKSEIRSNMGNLVDEIIDIHSVLFEKYMEEPFSLTEEEYEAFLSPNVSKLIKVIWWKYIYNLDYVSRDWENYIEKLNPKMKKLFLKGVYTGYEDALDNNEAKLPYVLKKKMSPVELINAMLDAKKEGLLHDPYNKFDTYEKIENEISYLSGDPVQYFIDGFTENKDFGLSYIVDHSWLELLREMFRDPNAVNIGSVKKAEEWARNKKKNSEK